MGHLRTYDQRESSGVLCSVRDYCPITSLARELFVEPEGEPGGGGFFITGFFVVAIPYVEGDGDGSAGLELDVDLLVDDFRFTLYY